MAHNNTEKTRAFPSVSQWVGLNESQQQLEATIYIRADQLRTEHQQTADGAMMSITFYNDDGDQLGSPHTRSARLGSYAWEPLSVNTSVPPGATAFQISLISAISGTLWMDGLHIRQVN